MKKIDSYKSINETVILSWKTPQIEKILGVEKAEEILLVAFENELYKTPNTPKINPREIIYAFTIKKDFTSTFLSEVKETTKRWIAMTSATWTHNVSPFYSAELDYILYRL